MDFVTCGQMKILEKRADESGLSYYQMMENAGTAAYEAIVDHCSCQVSQTKTLVFCGKGNNGGDGFVVARKLHEAGSDVTIILVDGPPVTPDAITNYHLLTDKGLCIVDMSQSRGPFLDIKGHQDIVVDAIYGTGFHGQLNSNALQAAAFISQLSQTAMVISLDIPSGLGGDALTEKQIDLSGIKAHFTVAFHKKKPVHMKGFSKKYCGQLIIVDIGINEEALW